MNMGKRLRDFGYSSPELLLAKLYKLRDTIRGRENLPKISAALNALAPVLPIIPPVTFYQGRYMFRARAHTDSFDGLPTHISQLTSRDSKHISNYGRANMPKQSVFYAANTFEVAIAEAVRWHNDDYDAQMHLDLSTYMAANNLDEALRPAIERKMRDHLWRGVALSTWRAKEPLVLVPIVNPAHIIDDSFKEILLKRTKKPDDMTAYEWGYTKAVFKFFGDEFARLDFSNEDDYMMTSLYANEIYKSPNAAFDERERPNNVDGILYLSCANNLRGYNYALTEAALSKIEFVSATTMGAMNAHRLFPEKAADREMYHITHGDPYEYHLDPLTGLLV